jgi:hypothetical protein
MGLVEIAKAIIFDNMPYMRYIHLTRPRIFIRHKPVFLADRMLHMDSDCKCSVENIFLVMSLKGFDT